MSDLKTCFKKVDYSLDNLLTYIEVGELFDSMYKRSNRTKHQG